jgi:hypothetical protein
LYSRFISLVFHSNSWLTVESAVFGPRHILFCSRDNGAHLFGDVFGVEKGFKVLTR